MAETDGKPVLAFAPCSLGRSSATYAHRTFSMEPLAEALAHVSETEETLALHDKSLAALGDALARHAAITTLDLSRCSLTSRSSRTCSPGAARSTQRR